MQTPALVACHSGFDDIHNYCFMGRNPRIGTASDFVFGEQLGFASNLHSGMMPGVHIMLPAPMHMWATVTAPQRPLCCSLCARGPLEPAGDVFPCGGANQAGPRAGEDNPQPQSQTSALTSAFGVVLCANCWARRSSIYHPPMLADSCRRCSTPCTPPLWVPPARPTTPAAAWLACTPSLPAVAGCPGPILPLR